MLVDIDMNHPNLQKLSDCWDAVQRELGNTEWKTWRVANRLAKGIYEGYGLYNDLRYAIHDVEPFNNYRQLYAALELVESDEEHQRLLEDFWKHQATLPIDYGVADSWEQILEKWPFLAYSKRKFLIEVHWVYKQDQPEHQGWRFHKNGEYIGDAMITHEYLADEPTVDKVLCFSIYEIKDEFVYEYK